MLLDDELPSLRYLKLLCQQIPELEVVKAFNKPLDFIEQQQMLDYDIMIMDIEMPEINGLQLAELIQEKSIIFTTAYSEYAADAFDLQAVDYIRKPLKLERLKQAIEKVQQKREFATTKVKSFAKLNSDKGKFLLYFDQIRYIRTATDSRDKVVNLTNNTEVTLKSISFDALEKLLPADQFCRVNKKELLALAIITAFSHDQISSNIRQEDAVFKTFILGDSYKTDFLQKLSL